MLVTEFPQTLDLTTDRATAQFADNDGDGCSLKGSGPVGPYTTNQFCSAAGNPYSCCTGANTGTCVGNGAVGQCIDFVANTVNVASGGTVFSSASSLHDILFGTTQASTLSAPAMSGGATCGSPPVINFSGLTHRCIIAGVSVPVDTPTPTPNPDRCATVTCTALDQCHVAGICDPNTGTCSAPPATDGTTCNAGNACVVSAGAPDACLAGVCVPAQCTGPVAATPGVGVYTGTTTSSAQPLQTGVTSPTGGTISITQTAATGSPPGGFSTVGEQVHISAPSATPNNPLVLLFLIDASQVPAGGNEASIQPFKDGAPVRPCTGSPGSASPDPCISDRQTLPGGDVQITVLTSSASLWTFAVIAPRTGCGSAAKASLLIEENGTPSQNKLVWKWSKGQATSFADFGNLGGPGGTTAYSLYVYSGATQTLAVTIPDSSTKWTVLGANKGYKYKDPSGAADGVQKAQLKAGAAGKAKALIDAEGSNLPAATLGLALPVTAQLVNSQNGVCYTTTFASAKNNTPTEFKATAP
jgi:hypothetical protein